MASLRVRWAFLFLVFAFPLASRAVAPADCAQYDRLEGAPLPPSWRSPQSAYREYVGSGLRYEAFFAPEISARNPPFPEVRRRIAIAVEAENCLRRTFPFPPLEVTPDTFREYVGNPRARLVRLPLAGGQPMGQREALTLAGNLVFSAPSLSEFSELSRMYVFDGDGNLTSIRRASEFEIDRLTENTESVFILRGMSATEYGYWTHHDLANLLAHGRAGWGHRRKVVYFSVGVRGLFPYDANTRWLKANVPSVTLRALAARDALVVGMQDRQRSLPGMFEIAFTEESWATLMPLLEPAPEYDVGPGEGTIPETP